ncbi:hypothetical protein IG631_09573 [Alternaria alternata]|nr:hypothetical protein IG631_09573 [Alternaria alternata]
MVHMGTRKMWNLGIRLFTPGMRSNGRRFRKMKQVGSSVRKRLQTFLPLMPSCETKRTNLRERK